MKLARFRTILIHLPLLLSSIAIAETTLSEPAIREELLQMRDADQKYRHPGPDLARVPTIDLSNQKRLKEIVRTFGWPTISRFGEDAAHAAWLIAQHADRVPEFQREVLGHLEILRPLGEVRLQDYALLFDRVNAPQRYGTQGKCNTSAGWAPRAIDSPDEVDNRRAEVGLGPLSAYIQVMTKICAKFAASRN
jgi:hypothetical protein